jgi:hypothetical protein
VPVSAFLPAALDVPPEEVQALVDVGDQRLFRRQAQAHRGQDASDFLSQRFASSRVPDTTRHQSSAYLTSR